MKNDKINSVLAYGAFFVAALLIGGGILAGDFVRNQNAGEQSRNLSNQNRINASLFAYAKQLESSNKPSDLAVSAFIQASNHPELNLMETPSASKGNIALLKKAITLGQDDPTLAWLEAMECNWMKAACNKDAALLRLIKLEPDNAAVDLLVFNEAVGADDTDAAWHALALGGSKKHFVLPIDAVSKMYLESLQNWNAPTSIDASFYFGDSAKDFSALTQDEIKKATAAGFSMTFALPAFQHYTKYCMPAPADPIKLQTCQRFTENLSADRNLLSRGVGSSVAVTVFADSPDKEKWQAMRMQHKWQMQEYTRLVMKDPGFERKHLRTWPYSSELDRIAAMLTEKGIPLSPSEGWSFEAAK